MYAALCRVSKFQSPTSRRTKRLQCFPTNFSRTSSSHLSTTASPAGCPSFSGYPPSLVMYVELPIEPQYHVADQLPQDDDYSPASIVVHGLEATGKTLILKSFLESSGSSFSWVPCHECVTTRHLVERIAATVSESIGIVEGATSSARCENVSVLAVQLQQILKESQRKHFLVPRPVPFC